MHTLEGLKSLQEALDRTEADIEAIHRALNESMIVSIGDLKGNVISANNKFCEISQYTEQELIGKNHSLLNSGYHPKSFWIDMWKTVSSGKVWRNEVKNKAKDGSYYWVDAVIAPIYDKNQKIKSYLSIRTLITDRKAAEEKIQKMNLELIQTNAELQQSREEIETQRDALIEKNKDITESILYAQRIQQAILPLNEHFKEVFSDHFVLFKPRDIVSGDVYYLEEVKNKTILAAIDCTGHGVPGALMSMLAKETLDYLVLEKELSDPGAILTELHKLIRKVLKQKETGNHDGMDICLLVIDKDKNQVAYAGAKNPLLYLTHTHELFELKADKMSIGGEELDRNRIYTTHHIENCKDAVFYLFSDGYQDQFGGINKRKFMLKNLKSFLFQIHMLPMQEQKQALDKKIDDWIKEGGERQIDDILVMGIKI